MFSTESQLRQNAGETAEPSEPSSGMNGHCAPRVGGNTGTRFKSFGTFGDAPSDDPSASLETTLRVIVKATHDQPPPAVRLKRWLKAGLREFGCRVEWAPADNPTQEGNTHD